MSLDDVVSICPTRTSRGWEATLSYHGKSYQVFAKDNHTAVWKTEREALRVAADYRDNRFHRPSAEVEAWWIAKANRVDPLPSEIDQGLQDLVAHQAYLRAWQ